VERAQRGDKRAFELLVEKYQRKLARLLSRFIRDPAEVEDVTQESVHQGLPRTPRVPRRQRFLYLAVPHRDQHGQELPDGDGPRAPTSTEVEAEEAEGFEGGRAAARHQHAGERAAVRTKSRRR
jgi:RNA polymerase sigma-70 factor (ECF subfamily)